MPNIVYADQSLTQRFEAPAPPSIVTACPLMYDDSGAERKATVRPTSMNHNPGAAIGITVSPKNAYLFDQEPGEALESRSGDAIEESAMSAPKSDGL